MSYNEKRAAHMQKHNVAPDSPEGNEEFERAKFTNDLSRIEANYLNDTSSWNLTRFDAFKMAVEQKFSLFPIECKVSWDTHRGINGDMVIEITIRTLDLGQLSTEIPISLIKSQQCPVDLPDQLFEAFKVKFEKKKQRLLKEWQKNNGPI